MADNPLADNPLADNPLADNRASRGRAPQDAPDRPVVAGSVVGGNVVAGNVVAGNVVAGNAVPSDSADEREDGGTAATRPGPVPGRAGTAPVARPPDAVPAAPVPPTVPVFTAAPPTAGVPATGAGRSAPDGDGTPVPSPRQATEREPAAPAAPADRLDEPLLADAAALRARWQRAQSDFVDDPRAAVADAATLVAQTAQAMIDALEQRQRLLRQEWERGKQRERGRENGQGNGSVADDPGDTERLRLTMRAYRALFNQICAR